MKVLRVADPAYTPSGRPQFHHAFERLGRLIVEMKESGRTDESAMVTAMMQLASQIHISQAPKGMRKCWAERMRPEFLRTVDSCYTTTTKQLTTE